MLKKSRDSTSVKRKTSGFGKELNLGTVGLKRSRDASSRSQSSRNLYNQPFRPIQLGNSHPMDELGAIEEEEHAGLNHNGTDSILEMPGATERSQRLNSTNKRTVNKALHESLVKNLDNLIQTLISIKMSLPRDSRVASDK